MFSQETQVTDASPTPIGTSITTLIGGNVTATPGAVGSATFRRQGTNGHGSNLSQGIFIQDKYQPTRRLTLNLGVRFEKEDLPSFNQFPSAINFGWGDKIAPRLGVCLRLTGDGRTKAFRKLRQVLRPSEICASARFVWGRYFPRRLFRDFPRRHLHRALISETSWAVLLGQAFVRRLVLSLRVLEADARRT